MDQREVFENDRFVMVKRLLMAACIWPYQNERLKFYGRAFIIFAVYTMMIPQLIRFYEEWYEKERNVEILAENFTGFLYFHGVLSKLCMSIVKEKKFQHLYEIITNDYKKIREPRERAVMEKYWSIARMLGIIYTSYIAIAFQFFIFTPQIVPAILDVIWPMEEPRPKMICYYAEYFIDQDKHLYELVLHTYIALAISILVAISVDYSYMTVAYHVIGLFNLLSCRMEQLSELASIDVDRDDEELHTFMIDTIKIHKKTLDLAEMVRSTYNENQFVTFVLGIASLAIGTIDVIANLKHPEVILRIGFCWVGLVAYLFFLNWPGQCLLDSNDELLVSIYNCDWYKLPKKTQFLLRFMMMRCLIPCQLTAGPQQMNFVNWASLLRISVSYLMAVMSLT